MTADDDLRRARLTAAEWNADHPVGEYVYAYPGLRSGAALVTRTRTIAWDLPGGDALVSVYGHAGGIALTHIEPREPNKQEAGA